MKERVFIFDFDGTLADSMKHAMQIFLDFLDEYGIKYEGDIIDKIVPMGYRKASKYFVELGVPMSEDEIFRTLCNRQVELYSSPKIELKNNVFFTLKKLYERGERLNILSGSTLEMITPCVNRMGFSELFENIWSVDEFGLTKNNPETYKFVAEKIGVDCQDCLFFDDNYDNLLAAKKAGMRTFGVREEYSKAHKENIKEISEKYIRDFSEVLDV